MTDATALKIAALTTWYGHNNDGVGQQAAAAECQPCVHGVSRDLLAWRMHVTALQGSRLFFRLYTVIHRNQLRPSPGVAPERPVRADQPGPAHLHQKAF